MGFAEDILKFKEKATLQASTSCNKAVETLFNNVVELSPNSPTRQGKYSTGVVKGNWYSEINGYNNTVGVNPDPSGASSYSRIKATLAAQPFLGKDSMVSLSNSTPWIKYVEYVGWPKDYSGNSSGWKWTGKQGPYSMVSTAIANFRGAYL